MSYFVAIVLEKDSTCAIEAAFLIIFDSKASGALSSPWENLVSRFRGIVC